MGKVLDIATYEESIHLIHDRQLGSICIINCNPPIFFCSKANSKNMLNGKKKFQGTIRDGIKTGTHNYWCEKWENEIAGTIYRCWNFDCRKRMG